MPPFLDTNVLVYFFDEDEPKKREVARGLVREHLIEGDGMMSVQVLREFYWAVRRLRRPLSEQRAREAVKGFAKFSPLAEDARMVLEAVDRTRKMSISFWDALIVEAALKAGADRLLTEDMQHGRVVEGLRIENPFL
jgi:predicted nucleic acid-binding protein